MFRHLVLFRVHDETSEAEVEDALRALRQLGHEIDAESWRVERSLDTRKGRVIIEEATFSDDNSFRRFRSHPAHIAAAHDMARIADWWVGDYHANDN